MAVGLGREELLERESELEQIEGVLDRLGDGGLEFVALEGVAGLGKTRLLETAAVAAEERGATVLRAIAAEAERGFAYGVARQLLEPVLRRAPAPRRRRLLSGAAASADWLLEPPGAAGPPPEQAALHGLHWLLAALCEEAPVAVLVDDAHWADPASLRFLDAMARRAADLDGVVVLGARPQGGPPELAALLARPVVALVRLAPLTAEGVRRLVEDALGPASERFVAECVRVTGGNPFLVRELAGALAAEGMAPDDAGCAQVGGIRPETVRRAAILRIAGLAAPAAVVARVMTVLGDGAATRDVAALAKITEAQADRALDALRSVDVLSAAAPPRFAHALVRESLVEDIGEAERAGLHAEAAVILIERGAPAHQIAAHVLAAPLGRVPGAAGVLRAAAERALTGGEPGAAVDWLRRAAEEAPSDLDLRLLLGRALVQAGEPGAAQAPLTDVAASHPDPRIRADAALAAGRARFLTGDLAGAVRTFDDALAGLRGIDEERRRLLQAERLETLRTDTSTAPPEAGWLVNGAAAAMPGDTPGERALLVYAAHELLRVGRIEEAVDAARRALGGGRLRAELSSDHFRFHQVVHVLVLADRLDEARAQFDAGEADAVRAGSPLGYALARVGRSAVHLRGGRVDAAETDARSGYELFLAQGWEAAAALVSCFLVEALLEADCAVEAAEIIARHDLDGPLPEVDAFAPMLACRARLRLALDRPEEALADALECGRRFEQWGSVNPVVPWRTAQALAETQLGDPAAGRATAALELERALAHGTPRACGIARRTVAVLAEGGPDAAGLESAAATLAAAGARLEQARTLVALGRVQRETGDAATARETLRVAADLAHSCQGAAVLATCAVELRAAGARPRRFATTGLEALTANERAAAALAAQGATNREIAQGLFLSVKTVETHLRNAYRKLSVSSRGELAGRLGSLS